MSGGNNNHAETAPCWRTIGVWGNQKPRCEKLDELVHCRNCDIFYEVAKKSLQVRLNGASSLEQSRELLERLSKPVAHGDMSSVPFRLGENWFGISTPLVLSVAHECCVHSLPFRSNRVLLGLVPVNGESVVCISIAEILGIKHEMKRASVGRGGFQRFLVVKGDKGRFAFKVDEVTEVVRYFFEDYTTAVDAEDPVSPLARRQLRINDRRMTLNIVDEDQLFSAVENVLR